jgi:hypothetical protein
MMECLCYGYVCISVLDIVHEGAGDGDVVT